MMSFLDFWSRSRGSAEVQDFVIDLSYSPVRSVEVDEAFCEARFPFPTLSLRFFRLLLLLLPN